MSIVEVRVCGRYKLGQRIGSGTFGSIYKAINIQNNQEVAVKMEEIKSKHPQILYEGKIMQNIQGGIGIPIMHWCGQESDYNFLVMELLGPNLSELFTLCNNHFTLKTVLMIGQQILSNLEYIHFKTYVHRDLKPENFLIGTGAKASRIYTIDFGLSKRYRDQNTFLHIPFRDKKPLIGTARYASLNAHMGYEISRRDDLEALCLMLIYFLKDGHLPWQGIQVATKDQKYQQIKEIKQNTTVDQLCQGLPVEFKLFLQYCRNLKFEDKPDYNYLKHLLKQRFEKEEFEDDFIYDWLLVPHKSRKILTQPKMPISIELFYGEEEYVQEFMNEQAVIKDDEPVITMNQINTNRDQLRGGQQIIDDDVIQKQTQPLNKTHEKLSMQEPRNLYNEGPQNGPNYNSEHKQNNANEYEANNNNGSNNKDNQRQKKHKSSKSDCLIF